MAYHEWSLKQVLLLSTCVSVMFIALAVTAGHFTGSGYKEQHDGKYCRKVYDTVDGVAAGDYHWECRQEENDPAVVLGKAEEVCRQVESNTDAYDNQDPIRMQCLGVIKAIEGTPADITTQTPRED